jgi:hypothetical protein
MKLLHGKPWLETIKGFPKPATVTAESLQRLFYINICYSVVTFSIILRLLLMILYKSSYLGVHPWPYMVQVNECTAAKYLFAIYPNIIITLLMFQSHIHMEYHVGGIIRQEPKMIIKITGCQ